MQAQLLHEELASRINAQLRLLEETLRKDVAALNDAAREINVPAVMVK
jgi:hypothetical protein